MVWDVSPDRLAHYLGRQADPDLEGQLPYGDWREPMEDVEDGCPGGWRRAPLVHDAIRHARRRTKDGNRVPSPIFDRAADNEVLMQAAMAYEAHENACHEYFEAQWAREQRAKAKRKG